MFYFTVMSDIGALQKEISALEELSRQLFMEYVDMLSVKVHTYIMYVGYAAMAVI